MPVSGLQDPIFDSFDEFDANAAAVLKRRANIVLALSTLSIFFR
jgi:hypothetical protein